MARVFGRNKMKQTSIQAYQQEKVKLARDEEKYWKMLTNHGGRQPDYEMKEILGWESARVSARRNGLVRKGLVYDVGERLLNPLTGKVCVVWGACIPDEVIL